MELAYYIASPLLWILYCALFGAYDSFFYPDVLRDRIYIKGVHIPHKIAFIMRVITAIGLAFALPLIWWKSLIVLVSFGLMLPFIHTGSLNVAKKLNEKRLDPKTTTYQDKNFFTSVAGWDGNIYLRIISFIIGISIYVLTVVL